MAMLPRGNWFATAVARLLLASLCFLQLAQTAFIPQVASAASAPNIITYQGRLLNANGIPVASASASVIFEFYTAVSGGSCVWSNSSSTCASATARTVTLTDGLFSENLGDTGATPAYAAIGDAIFADNAALFLQVTVNGEALTPRKQIVAAPYAMNADSLDGLNSDDDGATAAAIVAYNSSGNLQVAGNPSGSGVGNGSVFINPSSSDTAANDTILGVGDGGSELFRIDKEGDLAMIGDLTSTATGFDFLDTTSSSTEIDIGGVTADRANIIFLATNGTSADEIRFGNTNASTIFALTGGDDWSIAETGDFIVESVTGNAGWAIDAVGNASFLSGNFSGNLIVDGGSFSSVSPTFNFLDAVGNSATLDIGGVTTDLGNTINIATNSTTADVITIGNSNAASTVALVGGDDWSIATTGAAIFDSVSIDNGSGNISIEGTGSATTSGAFVVGVFDEFDNSNSSTVQDVLDDLDTVISGLSAGSSKWTDAGSFTFLTSTTDDLVVGDSTVAGASLFFDESVGQLDLGTDSALAGALRLYSATAATADPVLAADASGNLDITALATELSGDLLVTGGDLTSTSATFNFLDAAGNSTTLDVGGVTTDLGNTINIATNSTTADALTIGNSNAATTLALTGGDDWSLAATGVLTLSASAAATTAIVATDTDYTNALSIGDNNIIGTTANIDLTNFDVVGSNGNITSAGDMALNGGDFTSTSGTFNFLDAASNSANIDIGGVGTDIGNTINIATEDTTGDGINIGNQNDDTDVLIDGGEVFITGALDVGGVTLIGNSIVLDAQSGEPTGGINLAVGNTVEVNATDGTSSALFVDATNLTSGNAFEIATDTAIFSGNLIQLNSATASTGDFINITSASATATSRAIDIDLDNGNNNNDVFVLITDETTASGSAADTVKARITASGEFLSDVGFTAGGASTRYRDGSIATTSVTTFDFNDATGSSTTLDFGGVTADIGNTINIATNSTTADVLTVGNSNAATTLALTGGDDWSVSSAGSAVFDAVSIDNGSGNISLEGTGSATTSGASVIGFFDELDNSNATNLQDVLDDIDTAVTAAASGGGSKWTDAGSFIFLTQTTDDVVIGDTTAAAASFFFDESAGQLDLGTDDALAGAIRLYSATAATADPTLAADASGNLDITAAATELSGDLAVSGGDLTSTAGTFNFLDAASNSAAIDIGGVTTDLGNTINIATNSTTADAITLGNSNAGSTVAITGGDDWSITGAGVLTLSASASATTAIVATDTDYTNAISVGDNNIVGTTGAIDYTNFDVSTGGNVTVAAGQGIDTNGAGAFAVGNTNATSVSVCNSAACDTLSLGTNADADAISIGDATDTVSIRGIALNAVGSSNTTSGASLVGAFDEFDNSASTTVQDVLDDFDTVITGLASGSSKWTDAGSFTFLTQTADDLVVGDSTVAGASLFMDESAGQLDLGTDSTLAGALRLYSATAATADPVLAADASGNLDITATATELSGDLAVTGGDLTSAAATFNLFDAAGNSTTIELGGVTTDLGNTISIATNSTTADVITVGNSNAGSTVAITGGDDWSIATTGAAIFDSVSIDNGSGNISIEGTGSATTSGAFVVGAFDEFDNSNSSTVQDVLDDFDTVINGLAAGSSKWTDGGTFTFLTSTTDDLVVGDSTVAGASLFFDESAGQLDLGTDSTLAGTIRLYSATAATADPTLAADASGNLDITATATELSGDLAITGGDLTSTSATFNFLDAASNSTTLDIGGVTTDLGNTINIATNSTTADALTIGNSNAATTLALTGGDDWSLAATGVLTLSASAAATTAIVATDTDYTNALSIGDNNIVGTTAAIDFTNFDVSTTGNVTVAAGEGIDTNGAGNLALGTQNATAVGICNSTACDTVNIGITTDADTIAIGSSTNDDVSIADANWSITSAGLITTAQDIAINGGDFTSTSATFNFLDAASNSTTLDIGGVTTDLGNTINVATNSTTADVITIGNSNASSTVAITGGNDWSISAAGAAVFTSISGVTFGATTFNDDIDFTFATDGADSENFTIATTHATDVALTPMVLTFTDTAAADTATNILASFTNADDGGATGTPDALMLLASADTNEAVADGLQITSAAGTVVDAVDVSDADITNAIAVGANFVLHDGIRVAELATGTLTWEDTAGNDLMTLADAGTTGTLNLGGGSLTGTTTAIDFTNFDVSTAGAVTVAAGQGIDTNAAGALALGNTNASSVTLCNSAACDTISLGTNTDADTINIGGSTNDAITITDADWSISNGGTFTTDGDIALNGGDFTSTSATFNFLDAASNSTTLDIGGVTTDLGNTINIATNSTTADVITIGNNNTASTVAITGGDDWSITSGGAATFTSISGVTFGATAFNDDIDFTFVTDGADSENFTIATTHATDVALTPMVLTFTDTAAADTATNILASFTNADDGGATGTPDALMLLNNADTNEAVADGLQITSAAGTVVDAVDVSDADITNAIAAGANFVLHDGIRVAELATGTLTWEDTAGNDLLTLADGGTTGTLNIGAGSLSGTTPTINFTNFDVSTAGTITVAAAEGLDTNAAGTLALGNNNATAIGICNSASCDTVNIGTATDADVISIGGSTNDDVSIADAQWSITGPGLITTANDIAINGGDFTSTSATFNFLDAASNSTTLDIGGVTTDLGNTINVATNATTADTLTFGNSNAATTFALTGGDDWSLAATGVLTLSASAAQTTAIVLTDTDYTNSLSIGDNTITGTTANIDLTNFDVVGTTGAITTAGDLALNGGDLTSTGTLTLDPGGSGVVIGANDDLSTSGDLSFNLAAAELWVASSQATADTAITMYDYSGVGQDTTAGGDEDQIIFQLSQASNGTNVDEGADTLLFLTNNDGNDQINTALLLGGGAFDNGIVFQTGVTGTAIDLSGASTTSDIILDDGLNFSQTSDNDLDLVENGLTLNFDFGEQTVSTVSALSASPLRFATQSSGAASMIIESTAGGIDILASGATSGEDIDIVATGSSVNVVSTVNLDSAIVLDADANTSGGIDLFTANGGIDYTTTATNGTAFTLDANSVNTGQILNINANALSTGDMLTLSTTSNLRTAATSTMAFVFDAPTYTSTATHGGTNVHARRSLSSTTAGTTVTVSGALITADQTLTASDGGAGTAVVTYNGALLDISSTGIETSGTVNFTGNVAHFDQGFADATGAVVVIDNDGTGLAMDINGGDIDTEGGLQLDLNQTATTSGLCHSGADSDTTAQDRIVVVCSGAPDDYAEWHETESNVTFGDVVAFSDVTFTYEASQSDPFTGEILPDKVTKTLPVLKRALAGDQVFGVVSTSPNQTIGTDVKNQGSHPMPVALSGRVPVKVSDENGPIAAGDYLTISSTHGHAMKATAPGQVVGRALTAFTASGVGTITMMVDNGWWVGTIESDGSATVVNDTLVLAPTAPATAGSPAQDSNSVIFRGSAWNGSSAENVGFTLLTDTSSASDYRLSILNTQGVETAFVNNEGDLAISGRLYLSNQGVMQTEKYLYYDAGGSPLMDYVRTNAAGFGTGSYDFAEMFPSPEPLAAGDVVVFGEGKEQIKRSTGVTYDDRIVGVISTRPGFLAGNYKEGDYPVALAGRVPTNVTTENGAIAVGDPLTTSSRPGYAMKATQPGPIIGYALESLSGSEGQIVAFVRASYYDGSGVNQAPGANNTVSGASTAVNSLNVSGSMSLNGSILGVSSITSGTGLWRISETGDFITEGRVVQLVNSFQNEKVETYAATSREMTIQLSGTVELNNGSAEVKFDDIDQQFNDIISPAAPYRVFVTPSGITGQLYVADRTVSGFTVRSEGSADGVLVDWLVIAYHKDYEPELHLEVPEQQTTPDNIAGENSNEGEQPPVEEPVSEEPQEPTVPEVSEPEVEESSPEPVSEPEPAPEDPELVEGPVSIPEPETQPEPEASSEESPLESTESTPTPADSDPSSEV